MIEITLEKKPYKIPGSWEEVTIRQYHEMVQFPNMDPVRLLSIFTGLDYDVINNFDCSGFIEKVLPALSWLSEPFDLTKCPRKKTIALGGKTIEVIKEPKKHSVGQKLRMQKLVSKIDPNNTKVPSIMAAIVATYYCTYFDEGGIWKEDVCERVEQLAWDMPIADASPEVGFFLIGYLKSFASKK